MNKIKWLAIVSCLNPIALLVLSLPESDLAILLQVTKDTPVKQVWRMEHYGYCWLVSAMVFCVIFYICARIADIQYKPFSIIVCYLSSTVVMAFMPSVLLMIVVGFWGV